MADAGSGVNWPAVSNFGATIAGLPTDYYKALENGYNQRNRDLFVNGLPTEAGGNTDYGQMFKKVLEAGGAPGIERASHALQLGISAQAPQANADAVKFLASPIGNNGPGINMPSTQVPTITPGGTGAQPQSMPSVQNVAPRTTAQAQQPRQAGVSGDNGRDTMMTYITNKVGPENAGYVAANIKGVDVNAPMPAGYEVAADRAIAHWQSKSGGAQPQAQPSPQPTQQLTQAPTMPMASPVQATDPTLGGLVPNGWDPSQYLIALQTRAADPRLSAPVLKTYQTKIEAIQKALEKRSELPPEQKNYDLYRRQGGEQSFEVWRNTPDAQKVVIGNIMERVGKSADQAKIAADDIEGSHQLLSQLDARGGIFSGQWANEKQKLSKIGLALGFDIPEDKITNTEAFSALVGNQVAKLVKSFGSGTSITNQDREYAQKMAAGDITLDETSIRRIIEIREKINRGVITRHNLDVERFSKTVPGATGLSENLRVPEPGKYSRQPGALPMQAPAQQQGQIPRVQTPQEAATLGKGRKFYDPNGVLRVVP